MDQLSTERRRVIISVVVSVVLSGFIIQGECSRTTTTTTPPPTPCSAHPGCDSCVRNAKVSLLRPSGLRLLRPKRQACSAHPGCDSCVRNAKCLWCFTNNTCTDYPVSWVLPPSSVCKLSQARWGVCWVNFEALLIAMAVVSGTLIISITICCCYCCCCKRRQSGPSRDEERFSRRREEIRQRTEERKVERKTRHDEIRKKYGLMADSDHPYSKFENE